MFDACEVYLILTFNVSFLCSNINPSVQIISNVNGMIEILFIQ